MDKDVTDLVSFGNNDDECLPLIECVCGTHYGWWEFIISGDRDLALLPSRTCKVCGRHLYFKNSIRVFEVVDNGQNSG